MPKRKRSDIEDILEGIQDRALRIKASRLKARIDQGNKSLKDALQLARGFERQKLGRRQKKASDEPHTLLRLREEVIVLKELNVAKAALDYLFKQLVRTKRIRESPSFVALFGQDAKTEAPKSTAEANVLGRLFKANPVKEVLPGIMDGIRQVLNLDDPKSVVSSSERPAADVVEVDPEVRNGNSGKERELDKESVKYSKEISDEDEEDEIDFDAYESRLAGSSDDSEAEQKNDLDPMEISDAENSDDPTTLDEPDTNSPSQSDASESLASASTSTPASPRNQDQTQNKQDQELPSTSFLPSLNMGGYYSGSESDNDDPSNHHTRGPALPKPRKNRRGQRERQKLAELKFGKNAKHLLQQKRKPPKDSRNTGWDAKRGAVDDDDGKNQYDPRRKRFGRASFGGRSVGLTGANGDSAVGDKVKRGTGSKVVKKNDNKDVPLHPSWEAARKRKQESGNVKFEGKKITFD